MEIQIQSETKAYEEGELSVKQRVYTADCPDCGMKARHTWKRLYTGGTPHDCASVTIDCPHCDYHEWIFLGPDI